MGMTSDKDYCDECGAPITAGGRWLGLCRKCEGRLQVDPTGRVPVKPTKEPL